MKYRLTHTSTYDYESPVVHARHLVRKRPRQLKSQMVEQFVLRSNPAAVWSAEEFDFYGNTVDVIELIEPHETLSVTATSLVTVSRTEIDPALPSLGHSWEAASERIRADAGYYDTWGLTMDSPFVPRLLELREYGLSTFEPGRSLLSAILELNERIYDEFTYDPEFSDIATPLVKVLREKRGVCQDFAHLTLGVLRSFGLAARYVSGYLETFPPEGKPRLVGADASHAWASVFVPDYGWLDLDPTNNLTPSERHITVAWGRDYSEVSPLRGVVHGGGKHTVNVSVDVAPVVTTDELG
jgi:transglutaminase-like putative cysteine protease